MKTAVIAFLLAGCLAGCGPGETPAGGGTTSTTGSTSASGGTGGGGTGGGGTGGAGGSAPVEDCLDGIDTDGDGLFDCEDPDCQVGFECVDGPVSGWSGALRVQKVPYPSGEEPPPCPGGKPPAVYLAGPSAPECEACQCELAGATCNAPEMTCTTNSSCLAGFMFNTFKKADTACQDVPGTPPNGYKGCWLTKGAAILSAGTCNVSGGALKTPSPWAEEVRVCAASGAGCGAGKVCAPKAPAGFEPAVCMGQEGGAVCPAGWTSLDLAVYEGGTDHRACAPCSCDTSEVHCTGGKYTVYSSLACPAGGATKLVDSNTCVNMTGFFSGPDYQLSFRAELGTPGGIACSSSQATGTVETTGRRRICCRDPQ